jgi:hypothetical protein
MVYTVGNDLTSDRGLIEIGIFVENCTGGQGKPEPEVADPEVGSAPEPAGSYESTVRSWESLAVSSRCSTAPSGDRRRRSMVFAQHADGSALYSTPLTPTISGKLGLD